MIALSYVNVLLLTVFSAAILLALGGYLLHEAWETAGISEEGEVDDFDISLSRKNDWLLAYHESIKALERAIVAAKAEIAAIQGMTKPTLGWPERSVLFSRQTAPKLGKMLPLIFGAAFFGWGLMALAMFTAWVLQYSLARSLDPTPVTDLFPPNLPEPARMSAIILMLVAVACGLIYLVMRFIGTIRTKRLVLFLDRNYANNVRAPRLERWLVYLRAELATQQQDMAESLRLRREAGLIAHD